MTTNLGWHNPAPVTAPTAVQGLASGSLNGLYQWQVTFLSGWGETTPSASSGSVSITASTNAVVTIPLGPSGIIGRRLYRTVAGPGTTFKLVATINDNVTTSFSDTIADGSLGANAPVINLADSVQVLTGYSALSNPLINSTSAAITAATTPPLITLGYNLITTCPSGGQVQLLPLNALFVGMTLIIRNNGANACLIVPSSGNTINGGASLALGTLGALVNLTATSATNWQQIM